MDIIFYTLLTTIIILGGTVLLLATYTYKKRQSLKNLAQHNIALQEKYLEKSNRFETLFSYSGMGVALIHLDGKIFRVNPKFCELFGYNREDMLSHNFFYLIQPKNLRDLHLNIQELLDDKIKLYQAEFECFKRDGEILWALTSVSLVRRNDAPAYFILQLQNISLLKKAEERLKHTAYFDNLTGLPNRNKFEQELHHIIEISKRHKHSIGIMRLDLDRFKNINDSMSYEAGDMVLQVIAKRLLKAIRTTDLVARLGDDEFVLLISEVTKTEVVAIIAEKILQSMLQPIMVNEKEVYITASIGISIYPSDGEDMATLMKNSDLALFRAKDSGRNNYQFYSEDMTARVHKRLALRNALANALVKNEFSLSYQPIMRLPERYIVGVEALIRWQNKEFGIVTPSEIIALAEESGLIIPVSNWVIQTACQQLKNLHEMGFKSLAVAVNCSDRQFKQANFLDNLLGIVKEAGITPNCLEIEVTERIIMQDPENVLRILYTLKDIGMKIVIDDFGTGYWSLNNLRRISVDKIKIDKSFIKNINKNPEIANLTSAIITMINKIGITSVAEGVETNEQYNFLLKEGCSDIQGYYISQPLPTEELLNFLKHPVPDGEVINKTDTFV